MNAMQCSYSINKCCTLFEDLTDDATAKRYKFSTISLYFTKLYVTS